MTDTAAPPPSKRSFGLLIIGEFVVVGLAAAAMIIFDLGWLGAVMMAVLIAGFTLLIVRAGEQRAIATGNFSPVMRRYNRRMLTASAVYVLGLFGAIWAHDLLRPNGAVAFLFAFAPSIGVLLMVWAMARLVTEETDEYLRYRYVRSSLFGLGTLLTLATVWGFFEQFDLVPHVPTWAAVPVFAIGLGIANCTRWGRA
ncbi:MAG TPA: hypothetical protein VGR05_06380 [Sphingomicrobium sp.]|nr:hypothetical protein [Sphingomicrobium sp.]